MSTGEGVGGDARDDHAGEDRDRRGERIGIGGGDDSVTRIQLAARWAETYSPKVDSLGSVLKRFRAAYEYLDSVTHGVEPPDLDRELLESQPASPQPVAPAPAPSYGAPPAPAPSYGASPEAAPPPSAPPMPQPESRQWA
jgi:hypothetical protein